MKLFSYLFSAGMAATLPWQAKGTATPKDTLTSTVILANGAGTIQGNSRDSNGILSFKGIPYAQPPVNDLRWKPPQDPTPWTGTLDATQFGATCWGSPGLNALDSGGAPVNQSEDCLTINVWTPANTTVQKLPVMFWIYGGGFQYGSSSRSEYDGSVLASREVIVVSFNYRASTLGFLALSELDSEGSPSGNYGLQDMILALKWVQSNVAAFGGDASRITIWGESAGAHAVGLLLASPLTEGLINGAILESGAYWDYEYGSLQTFSEARALGQELESALKVNSVAQLRQISPDKLVSALPYDPLTGSPILFGPSLDKYVLPTPPASVFASGSQSNVPMLAGVNEREDVIFAAEEFPHDTPQDFQNAAQIWFGRNSLPQLSSVYPYATESQTNTSAATLLGDMTIREQTWEAAAAQSRINSNVFFYHYTYTSAYSPEAIHTAEIPFVFGNLEPSLTSKAPPGPEDQTFSESLQTYWTNFAKYGAPNHLQGSVPTWPKYTGGSNNVQELNATISPSTYPLEGFQFIKSFRHDGIFPLAWHSLNVSNLPN